MSYSELREAGVEFPASVVSELELAGIPIERCRGVGARGASVRLDPAFDASDDEPAAEEVRPVPVVAPAPTAQTRASGRGRGARVLAPVAVIAVIAAIGGLILTSLGGGGPQRPRIVRHPHAKTVISVSATTHTTSTTATTAPAPPPTPVSLALATQLEAQGHGLLESGSYGDAVAVLRRALVATGEDVNACVEPASSMCLTYAYALYDLGRALRLSGDPAAAVPVLERRLEIDNQRPTVLAELELARQGTI